MATSSTDEWIAPDVDDQETESNDDGTGSDTSDAYSSDSDYEEINTFFFVLEQAEVQRLREEDWENSACSENCCQYITEMEEKAIAKIVKRNKNRRRKNKKQSKTDGTVMQRKELTRKTVRNVNIARKRDARETQGKGQTKTQVRLRQTQKEKQLSSYVVTNHKVGPTYGRKMMTGFLATQGTKVSEVRVGRALREVNRPYHERRQKGARNLNLVSYSADYFGHKLHCDQNEKLVMFGLTHVAAIYAYSGKVVAWTSMPIKNNLTIYDKLYRSQK